MNPILPFSRRLVPALLVLGLLSGCERSAPDAEREKLEAERRALAAEEARLEAERAAWEAERGATVAPAADEAGTAEVVEAEPVEEGGLEAREEVLDEWEQSLGEREMELAGREALEDLTPEEPASFQEPVADFNLFYEELADYGNWFQSDDYGFIYQPTVVVRDSDWRPYTRGRWVCTNLGWTWISDEPFGWACYHYGRWVRLSSRGWCWVPGGEWAPAWVAWRHGGGHVGWAPLPPETLAARGRSWGPSVETRFGIADRGFCFVRERHFARPIWRHCLPVSRNAYLRARARACTNLHYRGGRAISGGPRYAALKPHVNRHWPVWSLDLDPLGGLDHKNRRHPRAAGRCWRFFAPSLDAPWNPALRPPRIAGRLERAVPERGMGGIEQDWLERFRETRRGERRAAGRWQSRLREVRSEAFRENRTNVRGARDEFRQRLVAKARAAREPGGRPGRDEATGSVASQTERGGRLPDGMRRRPQGWDFEPGGRAHTDEVRRGADSGARGGNNAARDRSEASRRTEMADAIRRRGAEAQAAQRQRAAEATRPSPARGGGAVSRRRGMDDSEAQARARQAEDARRAERIREGQRESARQAAAARARQQQETARRAAQERAREQQEGARRAAEERARQQQEMARRAAQERAREQQQAAARRAAQERARQQQDAARRAAQEQARRQQEQQREAARRAARQREAAQREARERTERQREAAQRQARERAREQQREAAQRRSQQARERGQRSRQQRRAQRPERDDSRRGRR